MAFKEVEVEEMKFVNELISSKDNIKLQLKLLKKYKDREDVQKYINDLKLKTNFEYVKYLIEKYYDGKIFLKRPKKTSIEKMFKLELPLVTRKEKIKNYSETDIKIGDIVLITGGEASKLEGEIINIDNEYSMFTVRINLFEKECDFEVDFSDVIKK